MTMDAIRCPNGHVSYPTHPRCPDCGEEPETTLDLSELTGEVFTWTTSTSTPPGVRTPNTLAIVTFDVDGQPVRAIGQVVQGEEVAVGDEVRPVYREELREPGAGIRESASQDWDGYRFEPV